MEYLEGKLSLICDLVLSGDVRLSILEPNGSRDQLSYVDLGKRRQLSVWSAPYLLWWEDGKIQWEPIKPETFEEQKDGEKVFKLLPYLKARKINYHCAKKDPDNIMWQHGWERVLKSGSAIVSHEGFIYQDILWADCWLYEWYIGYAHRGLRIDGKSVLALRTKWVDVDIRYNKEAVAFFKESFEKPMDFSKEEFDSKLDQIGLGDCKSYIWLQYWPDDVSDKDMPFYIPES